MWWCLKHKYFDFWRLTEVVRGSETSHLHVLLIVGATLQDRGDALHTEHREGAAQMKQRRSRSENEDEKRRRDAAKSWKPPRGIKPPWRNSFAPWGHRCAGFRPLFLQKGGDVTRTRPLRQSAEHRIRLALLCPLRPTVKWIRTVSVSPSQNPLHQPQTGNDCGYGFRTVSSDDPENTSTLSCAAANTRTHTHALTQAVRKWTADVCRTGHAAHATIARWVSVTACENLANWTQEEI